WTRRVEQGQDIVDGTQIVFPDVALRWTGRPAGLKSIISSLGANARVLETRQVNGTEPLAGDTLDDRGKIRVRTYPLSGSLVFAGESRLTDNGRRAFSMSADTDVAENLSSSFVISRVESFDRNLNRRFTQTVLSAVMHLQFYAGDFK